MGFLGKRTPLGRAGIHFNFLVGVVGVGLLIAATVRAHAWPERPPLVAVTTFLGLFVFARFMRFEVPPEALNITASLVVPIQIAAILLLGPVTTAWLALPAFMAEVVKERALSGLEGERRRAVLGIVSFNLGMEALVTLAGGATWAALRPPSGRLGASLDGHLALLATFVVFKAVNESLMLAGNWLRGRPVREHLAGARTTVLIETLTLPIAALMVLVYQGLHLTGFYLLVAATLLASIVVRGLTRARAGLAVANVGLERKVKEVETLARIGQAISADIELGSLLETIHSRCRDILMADHFFIALYTEGESELRIALEVVQGKPQEAQVIPLGEGLTSHVILTRAPLLIRDLASERDTLPVAPLLADDRPNLSWLGVPMIARGETVGAIVLQEERPGAYDDDDVRVLSAIASQAAISVKNARLHQDALHALRIEAENRQLKRLNAKKSEFVNMVAHQFRTPLTAVIGYANLLVERVQRRGSDIPDIERHLLTVHGESKRLADMVEELLNLSRIRSGRLSLTMQDFDLLRLLRETLAAYQVLSDERGIVVDVVVHGDLGGEGVPVHGDSNFLRHAFANVLANAVKYAPPGSRVEVAVSAQDDGVRLDVIDQGPGIADDDLERIFDEFFRAPGGTSDKPGTGLGLSITRGIVEAHGGRIWAERRGEGTAFCVSLPSREASDALAHPLAFPASR